MNDTNQDEDREIEEPREPIDPPQEKNLCKRKLAWVREAIQGAEKIWGSRRSAQREENNQVLLRLCSTIV